MKNPAKRIVLFSASLLFLLGCGASDTPIRTDDNGHFNLLGSLGTRPEIESLEFHYSPGYVAARNYLDVRMEFDLDSEINGVEITASPLIGGDCVASQIVDDQTMDDLRTLITDATYSICDEGFVAVDVSRQILTVNEVEYAMMICDDGRRFIEKNRCEILSFLRELVPFDTCGGDPDEEIDPISLDLAFYCSYSR